MNKDKTVIVSRWEDLCPWLSNCVNKIAAHHDEMQYLDKKIRIIALISGIGFILNGFNEKINNRRFKKLEDRINAMEEDTE